MAEPNDKIKISVLVSGGGSNLQSILDKIDAGLIDAQVRVVVSNKADAYGLERARLRGIGRQGKSVTVTVWVAHLLSRQHRASRKIGKHSDSLQQTHWPRL